MSQRNLTPEQNTFLKQVLVTIANEADLANMDQNQLKDMVAQNLELSLTAPEMSSVPLNTEADIIAANIYNNIVAHNHEISIDLNFPNAIRETISQEYKNLEPENYNKHMDFIADRIFLIAEKSDTETEEAIIEKLYDAISNTNDIANLSVEEIPIFNELHAVANKYNITAEDALIDIGAKVAEEPNRVNEISNRVINRLKNDLPAYNERLTKAGKPPITLNEFVGQKLAEWKSGGNFAIYMHSASANEKVNEQKLGTVIAEKLGLDLKELKSIAIEFKTKTPEERLQATVANVAERIESNRLEKDNPYPVETNNKWLEREWAKQIGLSTEESKGMVKYAKKAADSLGIPHQKFWGKLKEELGKMVEVKPKLEGEAKIAKLNEVADRLADSINKEITSKSYDKATSYDKIATDWEQGVGNKTNYIISAANKEGLDANELYSTLAEKTGLKKIDPEVKFDNKVDYLVSKFEDNAKEQGKFIEDYKNIVRSNWQKQEYGTTALIKATAANNGIDPQKLYEGVAQKMGIKEYARPTQTPIPKAFEEAYKIATLTEKLANKINEKADLQFEMPSARFKNTELAAIREHLKDPVTNPDTSKSGAYLKAAIVNSDLSSRATEIVEKAFEKSKEHFPQRAAALTKGIEILENRSHPDAKTLKDTMQFLKDNPRPDISSTLNPEKQLLVAIQKNHINKDTALAADQAERIGKVVLQVEKLEKITPKEPTHDSFKTMEDAIRRTDIRLQATGHPQKDFAHTTKPANVKNILAKNDTPIGRLAKEGDSYLNDLIVNRGEDGKTTTLSGIPVEYTDLNRQPYANQFTQLNNAVPDKSNDVPDRSREIA